MDRNTFEFGDFRYDTNEKVLLRGNKPLAVRPKALQILEILLENQGHIVEKNVLMDKVWANTFVEESNLTFTIRQLRKTLGDHKKDPLFIETIPRRGYRFIAEARPLPANAMEQKGRPGRWDQTRSAASSRPVLVPVAAILVGLIALSGMFFWRGGFTDAPPTMFGPMSSYTFTTVAVSEKPMIAGLSPNGKYLAYSGSANGMQSLWLRQLSTGLNTQIIGPQEGVTYNGIEFAAGGDYIYVSRRFRDGPAHIDRFSILGGAAKENILNDVDGAFSISPDGRLISFRRYEPQKRSLLIAEVDGNNERTVFETAKTITDNVFSHDGTTIAFASGQSDTGERDFGVFTIDLASGQVSAATAFQWYHVRGIAWLPDQSGLVVTAAVVGGGPSQLWTVSLSDGEVSKIADSQAGFTAISASTDMSELLMAKVSLSSTLYVAPSSAPGDLVPVTEASEGVAWMPNGELIYTSLSGTSRDIWKLGSDRISQKQLTTEDSVDFDPEVSPDGRHIVFTSDRSGRYNVWRMNSDGAQPVALTHGDGEQRAEFTPDGAFVLFNSMQDGSLWKVPTGGGEPIQISANDVQGVAFSPDGTKFAHYGKVNGRRRIFLRASRNAEVMQEFDTPEGLFAGHDIVWINGGTTLLYSADDANAVSNLWAQDVNGGPPQMVTDYSSDEIFYISVSPDGSQLALTRGTWRYEIILASTNRLPAAGQQK